MDRAPDKGGIRTVLMNECVHEFYGMNGLTINTSKSYYMLLDCEGEVYVSDTPLTQAYKFKYLGITLCAREPTRL